MMLTMLEVIALSVGGFAALFSVVSAIGAMLVRRRRLDESGKVPVRIQVGDAESVIDVAPGSSAKKIEEATRTLLRSVEAERRRSRRARAGQSHR